MKIKNVLGAMLVLVLALGLCACQKSEPVDAPKGVPQPAAKAPAPAPTAMASRELAPMREMMDDRKIVSETSPVDTNIVDVQMAAQGTESALTGARTENFSVKDKAVFVSIQTKGTAAKYTLSAKWLQPSGELLTEYAQTLSKPGVNDTVFSLSRPDGWPPGEYKIELSINGKKLTTKTFGVQ